MNHRFAKTAAMLALAALSTAALAQETYDTEPPGRVGRVSLAQGKVSISGDVGDTVQDALVNWPVTTRNLITTDAGGRTEVRIGSTAIRVDGESSLEITELDDDSLRLRLHYGSASVRILSDEVLPEFELSTPQGRVRMLKPGRLRVDAERVRDTSVVSVFDGEAQVDGGGASLMVRAGRSAELRDEDVRTLQARADAFDSWTLERDRLLDGSRSARYVTTEMTGYEELDRHGIWQDDAEYGALWLPTVASGWVPYRDGRWTWISPWGWTWVDNAPWGYAPFHYGRWVQVRNRWAWAPGHRERRPIWAPALVGWVGGNSWNVHFNAHGSRPATGWYPLGPRDHYKPGYRLSDERLRRLNEWRGRDDGPRGRDRDGDGRPDYRNRGLTIVPHANFGQRGPVVVSNVPRATPPQQALPNVPGAQPPAPQGVRVRDGRRDEVRDRVVRDGRDLDGGPRPERFERPERAASARPQPWVRNERDTSAPVPAPAPVLVQPARPQPWVRNDGAGGLAASAAAQAAAQANRQQEWQRPERDNRFDRGDRGDRGEGRRERPQPLVAMPQPAAQPAPQQFSAPPRAAAPQQAIAAPPPRAEAPAAQRIQERGRGREREQRDQRSD